MLDKLGIDLEPADVVTLIRLRFPVELEEVLVNLLTKTSAQGILVAKNLFIHGEMERGLSHPRRAGRRADGPRRRPARHPRERGPLRLRPGEDRAPGRGRALVPEPGPDLPDLQRHLQQDRVRQAESPGPGRGRGGLGHRQEGPDHRPQGRRGHGRRAQDPGSVQREDPPRAPTSCRISPASSSSTPSCSSPSGAISGRRCKPRGGRAPVPR
ncbi:MAG: hypothetical protein MZW92_68865 [Comamonadaceae bacterium]|nr:hypothetical protein [Comamonadaceae bacterium]